MIYSKGSALFFMTDSTILYLEIDAACFIIILLILFHSGKAIFSRYISCYFHSTLFCLLIFTLLDAVSALIRSGVLILPIYLIHVITIVYLCCCCIAAWRWFLFTEDIFYASWIHNPLKHFLTAIPWSGIFLLTASSPFTGLIYRWDDELSFYMGPLFYINFLIPCLYLLPVSIKSLYRSCLRKYYCRRKNYRILASFALIPCTALLLHPLIANTPITAISVTITITYIYIQIQELLLIIDPLTKLSNRYKMTEYLEFCLSHTAPSQNLYLFSMDLDYFKQINDTYGHPEGDQALIAFAQILKRLEYQLGGISVRYGGDEFAFLYESSNPDTPLLLKAELNHQLDQHNQNSGKPYSLQASIGYARYLPEYKDITAFIKAADQNLYEEKQNRKLPSTSR